MSNKIRKIILSCLAYGGLLVSTAIYLSWVYAGSLDPMDIKGQFPVILLAFIFAIVSLVSNLVIIIKYKAGLRIVSIFLALLTLIIIALLIIPLGFSIG